MSGLSAQRRGSAILARVLERFEHKRCPQGLHVIAEELQWMGERSITYEKVLEAIRAELKNARPRVRRVAEGVYWFADAEIPLGWSLYRDRRMLPCFYRKYPPEISWEDVDLPDNLLPPPSDLPQ